MTNLVAQTNKPQSVAEKLGYTEEQLDLVKRTIAKNATDDELKLFFYRCKELELNPLMPGQVYFIKYSTSAPGTIIVGLDGFRIRAHRTGQLSGIKRGVIRDENGKCIGGWADVYRKDWTHPAHEEVALSEYNTGKGNWVKMEETMIKKVAEVAALRMAFPDHLGGLYIQEEMDKSHKEVKPSKEDILKLVALAKSAGVQSKVELNEMTVKEFGHPILELTFAEYDKLCDKLVAMTPVEAKTSLENPMEVK